jgi:hypothetical protein
MAHAWLPSGTLQSARLAVLVVGLSSTAWAQEPAPARLTAENLGIDGTIALTRAWRFCPGDDPARAEPSFEDSVWAVADPRFPPGDMARFGWHGSGCFRRHLRIGPELWGRPLALRLEAPGSTTVFLDGRLVLELAAPASTGAPVGRGGEAWTLVVPMAPAEHLLVVRHVWTGVNVDVHGGKGRGFHLAFEQTDLAGTQREGALARERRLVAIRATLTALPLFLAALHLHLFLPLPKARENFYYALCEEVVLSGLPLGSRLAGRYEERFVALSAGDTLLLTSDGLPEQRNAADRPLGFEGAAEALRQAAGAPPGTIVERLMAAAAAWREGVEQTDDITLVAVRVEAPAAATPKRTG